MAAGIVLHTVTDIREVLCNTRAVRTASLLNLFPSLLFMINFVVWLIMGGLIGWLASKVMNTDAQQGIGLNIIVGIVGAYLGGLLITPLLGSDTINQSNFSIMGLVVSFIGAVLLLAIVNFVRRGALR